MKRVAMYIRVSTDRQAQEGDSIDAQRSALKNYIQSHQDMIFVGEYLDDGISGTKNDRDAFQRMLSDVKEGRIDLVLVTKLDRLHRSLRNFLNMQDILDKHNCNWLAIWEPIYDSSSPQGRMIINTMVNLAQFEAEQTGQRIRQVFDYKRKQGEVLTGRIPFGYSIKNKHLVPDENADKVRTIFKYYAETNNLAKTTEYAMSIGITRSKVSIREMLLNQIYIGVHGGNSSFCEPIIDNGLFEKVGKMLSMNVKKNAKPGRCYIFSGLIKCECGNRMGGGIGSKELRYYRCSKRINFPGSCQNNKRLSETKLEKYLTENISRLMKDYIFGIESNNDQRKDNSSKINALYRKIDKLKELFVNELIGIEEYKNDKEKYLSEIEALREEQSKAVDLSHYKGLIEIDIPSFYGNLSNEDKRSFWRSIIREIRFDRECNVTVIFL